MLPKMWRSPLNDKYFKEVRHGSQVVMSVHVNQCKKMSGIRRFPDLSPQIAAIYKAAADELIAANAKSKNRYKYQAKRTFIIGMVKEDVPEMLMTGISLIKIEELIESASKKKSQIKPGRSYPRRRNTRARKHYDNRKATF